MTKMEDFYNFSWKTSTSLFIKLSFSHNLKWIFKIFLLFHVYLVNIEASEWNSEHNWWYLRGYNIHVY